MPEKPVTDRRSAAKEPKPVELPLVVGRAAVPSHAMSVDVTELRRLEARIRGLEKAVATLAEQVQQLAQDHGKAFQALAAAVARLEERLRG